MSAKIVFLSHIHEERELALLLKSAIEDEFGGFVDVFVSSDGVSISSGANFLKKIEQGLTECCAGIYLISPKSVKRSWIHFELGAIWIRNILQVASKGKEIPLIPVCHSGSTPSNLPSPLNNLNGILGTESNHLENAFLSLQATVGGRGKLKTNFDQLASQITTLSDAYSIGQKIRNLLNLLVPAHGQSQFLDFCIQQVDAGTKVSSLTIDQTPIEDGAKARDIVRTELSGRGIEITSTTTSMAVGNQGTKWVEDLKMIFPASLFVEHKDSILSK